MRSDRLLPVVGRAVAGEHPSTPYIALPESHHVHLCATFVPHRFDVLSSPSPDLALTNCLFVNPSDFANGQHVMLKRLYPMTVR